MNIMEIQRRRDEIVDAHAPEGLLDGDLEPEKPDGPKSEVFLPEPQGFFELTMDSSWFSGAS